MRLPGRFEHLPSNDISLHGDELQRVVAVLRELVPEETGS